MMSVRIRHFVTMVAAGIMLTAGCSQLTGGNDDDDYEPNDSRDAAQVVELGKTYDAVIGDTDDDDWFSFTTAHSGSTYDDIQISVTGVSDDLYIRLELYGSDGASLDWKGTTTQGQSLTYTFATSGNSFYVRFSGWGGYASDHGSSGSYSFTIANLNVNDDFGANHTRDAAVPITLATTYNGAIVSQYEDDWFSFTTAHASNTYDKMQISVTNVSADLYIHMELYDNSGTSLATYGTTTKGQSLTYTFATPGNSFYVRFSGWGGYASDHLSTGTYSFTISNLNANDIYVPNHTFATAVTSLAFDQTAEGVLVSKYEDDYFRFTNPVPGTWNTYTISLTNVGADLYGAFSLYAEDRSTLVSYTDIGSSTKGADVTYTLVSNEDAFYVRVSGWGGYASDHGSSGAYDLTVTCPGNDDNEPDDTFDQARLVDSFSSGTLSGTILATAANNNGGDYEFFKVTLNAGKKVSWSVAPDAANTELHFNVYDQAQTYQGNADGTDGETITGSMNNAGASGTLFYIRLGGYVGDNGQYTISFTETAAD